MFYVHPSSAEDTNDHMRASLTKNYEALKLEHDATSEVLAAALRREASLASLRAEEQTLLQSVFGGK